MAINTSAAAVFGKELFRSVGKHDISGLACELAYRFFLSLFPFFIFLAAIGGFAADLLHARNPTDEVMDLLGSSLPSDTSDVVRRELDNIIASRNAGLVSIGIIGAVWAASAGFGTIIKGLNRVYGVDETRPIWLRYLLAIGLTVLTGVAIIAAFVIMVAGEVYGLKIADGIGLRGEAAYVFTYARWPVVIALVMAAMAFLFWAAPNAGLPFKLISPGAVMFTVLWLVGTWLFGFYVSRFGSYNATYGALGAVVVLLIWLYLTGFLMLLGAQVNAVLTRQVAPEEMRPRTEDEPETLEANEARPDASVAARPSRRRKATYDFSRK